MLTILSRGIKLLRLPHVIDNRDQLQYIKVIGFDINKYHIDLLVFKISLTIVGHA